MINSLILVAAGSGVRMGASCNKLLLSCEGHPIIYYTLKNVFQSHLLSELIVVIKPEEFSCFDEIIKSLPHAVPVIYATGGRERYESVLNGLARISDASDKVLIHDGARPLVDGQTIDRAFTSITPENPAVVVTLPCVDTIKTASGNYVINTPDRSMLFRAQTPQGAMTAVFRQAVRNLENGRKVTDDASILEQSGIPVHMIPGKESFFKVTTPEDLNRFDHILQKNFSPIRIGQGYDIHQFSPERPLFLGGIRISEKDGLLGHSDADVLLHAIMDALLGAAGLPDIGHYFPDTDDRFKNADSAKLLGEVKNIIRQSGFAIGNIDSTVIAEKPKLARHIPAMKQRIADILDIDPDAIGIKATTNEQLGALGRAEGIAALASALLFRRS
jgi:2-C-methyl-D-erythritol 4-phosphate cytidylyltransferase/2-C-methyl-D-erythritol 2,4-cyclodiphosphate synthase